MPDRAVLYLTGVIDDNSCTRVRSEAIQAANSGVDEILLVISSTGGWNHPAYWLHDFLRGLHVPVHTYAIGEIRSIAIPVFLGGEKRIADPDSWFTFHAMEWNFPGGGQSYHALHESIERLDADITRYASIVQASTCGLQPAEVANVLRGNDSAMIVPPRTAQEMGIVHEIRPFDMRGEI